MIVPDEFYYTKEHEWALKEDNEVKIGITDYAQDALGDIVYISLPEVGKSYKAGEVLGEVESTKSVSEIYAPVTGVVKDVNLELENSPEKINEDPYNEGWICKMEIENIKELENLLSAEAYRRLIEGNS